MKSKLRHCLLLTLILLASRSGFLLSAQEVPGLEGTSWQLVQIQSMNDTVFIPPDPGQYTVRFRSENRLVVQSDCNRAGATWQQNGKELSFTGFTTSQNMCNPGTLHNRFVSALLGVRSFVSQNGHLFLATFADGAILEFEPLVFSPR